MENLMDRAGQKAAVYGLLFVGLLFVFVFIPMRLTPLSLTESSQCQRSETGNMTGHRDALEVALSRASMENKTVIITIINKAYVEGDKPMLDLFLDSFWLGEDTRKLVDHLLLVAIDRTSFERCQFLRLHCYMLELDDGRDPKAEKLFMSDDFIKMMWRRTLFLGDVLKRGYSFIFTDTDVMWLRNPFPRLSQNETIDIQISTDFSNGNGRSVSNDVNTGFYMIRSNNKTISLFDAWYARKNNSKRLNDQTVFQNMMREGVLRDLELSMKLLDTNYFSGFCKDSRDFKAVTTVHANCCLTVSAKRVDLMVVLRDWKMFKTRSANDSFKHEWSKHEACPKSWKKTFFNGVPQRKRG